MFPASLHCQPTKLKALRSSPLLRRFQYWASFHHCDTSTYSYTNPSIAACNHSLCKCMVSVPLLFSLYFTDTARSQAPACDSYPTGVVAQLGLLNLSRVPVTSSASITRPGLSIQLPAARFYSSSGVQAIVSYGKREHHALKQLMGSIAA